MSIRENPVILRQSFIKLWSNNIYLPEGSSTNLQFISLYKTNLALQTLFAQRYIKILASRFTTTDFNVDNYSNIYKYRKNTRWRKKRRKKSKLLQRRWKHVYQLVTRFSKNTLFQQLLQQFSDLFPNLPGVLFRLREPAKKLPFMKYSVISWARKKMKRFQKEKHFINTIHQIIFLHYYKTATAFSVHFGRELARIRKKAHWKLIYGFKSMLDNVPSHPRMRRQFHALIVEITGRPKGRQRTFTFRMADGFFASQTYHLRVAMGVGESLAKVGVLGIKTRISY